MHRQVRPTFFKRNFEFLDKQALSADFAERTVQNLVAPGGHAQQSYNMPLLLKQTFDMFCLPKGEAAFARSNGEVAQSRNLFVIGK